MVNKVAAHATLQRDADLKLFLESESFNVDVKHKERREPIPGESKGVLGSLGINVGGGSKFVEQDDVSFFAVLRPLVALPGRFFVLTGNSGFMNEKSTWTPSKTNSKPS